MQVVIFKKTRQASIRFVSAIISYFLYKYLSDLMINAYHSMLIINAYHIVLILKLIS